MKPAIPIWVTIVASLITFSGLAFSVTLYFSPQTFFPASDFLSKDTKHFTDMWAMRQFVFAVFFAYALVMQQVQPLKLALALMILLNAINMADSIAMGDKKSTVESLVYSLLSVMMLAALARKNGKAAGGRPKAHAIQAG